MTRLSIIHTTAYKYNKRVTLSYNEARMTPLTDPQQVVLESVLKVSPSQAAVSSYRDYWGTRVTAFDMQMPHEHLEVVSNITVEVHRAEKIPSEADIVGWDVLASPETLKPVTESRSRTTYSALMTLCGRAPARERTKRSARTTTTAS